MSEQLNDILEDGSGIKLDHVFAFLDHAATPVLKNIRSRIAAHLSIREAYA